MDDLEGKGTEFDRARVGKIKSKWCFDHLKMVV